MFLKPGVDDLIEELNNAAETIRQLYRERDAALAELAALWAVVKAVSEFVELSGRNQERFDALVSAVRAWQEQKRC